MRPGRRLALEPDLGVSGGLCLGVWLERRRRRVDGVVLVGSWAIFGLDVESVGAGECVG